LQSQIFLRSQISLAALFVISVPLPLLLFTRESYVGKVREKVIEKSALLLGYFQFGGHQIGLSKTPTHFTRWTDSKHPHID